MGTAQHNVVGKCSFVPPIWRVAVFLMIHIVVVVLVVTGSDVQTALTCAAGSSLAAAHTANTLFGTTSRTRKSR